MTWEWLALTGLALAALVLLLLLAGQRRRTNREVEVARAEVAQMRARLDRLEQERSEAVQPPRRAEREYRITGVGGPEGAHRPSAETVPARLERAVFVDHVLREGVIRLGSLAHGVRSGLSPETRNRIRFEMRREVRRARKQRQADMRTAHREWQARQRDDLGDGSGFRETA